MAVAGSQQQYKDTRPKKKKKPEEEEQVQPTRLSPPPKGGDFQPSVPYSPYLTPRDPKLTSRPGFRDDPLELDLRNSVEEVLSGLDAANYDLEVARSQAGGESDPRTITGVQSRKTPPANQDEIKEQIKLLKAERQKRVGLLRDYRKARVEAATLATSQLRYLVETVPEELLRDSPHTLTYLAAHGRDAPEMIAGAPEALEWLSTRYGQYKAVKGAFAIGDGENRKVFDKWVNKQLQKEAEAGNLPLTPDPIAVNEWAEGIVNDRIRDGSLPKSLLDDVEAFTAERDGYINEAVAHGNLPVGILTPGPIDPGAYKHRRVVEHPIPGRAVPKKIEENPLVWRVPKDYVDRYPVDFAYVLTKARMRFPDLEVEYDDSTEEVPTDVEEIAIASAERSGAFAAEQERGKQTKFGMILEGLGMAWDLTTAIPSGIVRYGAEGWEWVRTGDTDIPTPVEVYRDVVPAKVRHLPDLLAGNLTDEQIVAIEEEDRLNTGVRFGNQLARLAGYKPSDSAWDEARIISSLIGDFMLSSGFSGITKAAKIANTRPVHVEDIIEFGYFTGKPKIRPIAKGTGSRNVYTNRLLPYLAQTNEEWAASSQGRKFFDIIENEVRAVRGEVVDITKVKSGDIVPTTVELPVKLLRNRRLLDETRGVAYRTRANLTGGDSKYFENLKANLASEGQKKDITIALEADGKVSIVDGTHRLLALEELGVETVKVHLAGASYYHSKGNGLEFVRAWFRKNAPETARVIFGDGSLPLGAKSKEQVAARIMDRFGRNRMTPRTARLLASATTRADMEEAVLDALRGGVTEAGARARDRSKVFEINKAIKTAEKEGMDDIIPDLLAQREFLDLRLSSYRGPEPIAIREFPTTDWWRDAVRGYEHTPLADIFRGAAKYTGMDRFFTRLPGRTLVNPFGAGGDVNPNAFNQGFEDIRNMLHLLGASADDIEAATGRWLAMKNADDLFDVMEYMGVAIENSTKLSTATKVRLSTFFKTTEDDMRRGLVFTDMDTKRLIQEYEDTIWHEKQTWNPDTGQMETRRIPKPSVPTERIGAVPLPTAQEILDANSLLRKLEYKLTPISPKRTVASGLGYAINTPLQVFRHALDVFGYHWKRTVLFGKLPLSLPFRIQSEQMIRMAGYDYASLVNSPVQFFRSLRSQAEFGQFVEAPDKFLGAIVRTWRQEYGDLLKLGNGKSIRTAYHAADLGTPHGRRFYLRAWTERLKFRAADPLYRVMARSGKKGAVAWLKKNPTGRSIRKMMDSILTEANGTGLTTEQWVDRLWEEMMGLTGGHPDLIEALHTGRVVTRKSGHRTTVLRGKEVPWKPDRKALRAAQRELRDLRRAETDAPGWPQQGHMVSMFGSERRRRRLVLEGQLKRLEAPEGVEIVNIDTGDTFANYLGDLVDAKAVRPPPTVFGDPLHVQVDPSDMLLGKVKGLVKADGGIVDRAFQYWYSKPDLFFSRRPLFRQAAADEYARLTAMGVSKGRAEAEATRYAAHRAADLLYDLGAHTSGHNFMKNIAPFFPAWQELTTTWLKRIPAELGPSGLGHMIMATRAQDMIRMFREIGVIQKDSNGTDIVPLPFIGDFIESVTGYKGEIKASFKLSALNMIFGGLFGLGPIAAIPLAAAAKKFGGMWEDVADVFLPYGLEIPVGPGAANKLWAAAFKQPAPWEFGSMDYQKTIWDHAVEDGMVVARSTTPPPKFPPRLKELENTANLTPEQESEKIKLKDTYETDKQLWFDEILSKGQGYARSIYLARGLSGMFLPATIQITPDFVEERNKFWDEMDKESTAAGRQDKYIDFLREHPNMTWALNPKTIVKTGQTRTTYSGHDDDEKFRAYNADLRDKRIESLEPEEFMQLAYAQESYRVYQMKRQDLINSYQSAGNILRNLSSYWEETEEITTDWDNFTRYNPQAIGLVKQIKQDRALGDDNYPTKTLEAERITEAVRTTRKLSEYFEDEFGRVDADFRKVLAVMGDILTGETYGEPTNPIEKDMAWWWDNVGNPYYEQKQENIEKAKSLAFEYQGPWWEKNRELSDAQKQVRGPSGELMPTPDEVSWGMMNPEQQDLRVLQLQTKKIEYLNDFERNKAGWGGKTPAEDKAISEIVRYKNKRMDQAYDAIDKKGTTTSSNAGKAILEAAANDIETKAHALDRKYKTKMASNINIWTETPIYQRLNALDKPQDPTWDEFYAGVNISRGAIEAAGFKPGGGGKLAEVHYDWIEKEIEKERKENPDSPFSVLMDKLETVMVYKNRELKGRDMYLAVFYGFFPR